MYIWEVGFFMKKIWYLEEVGNPSGNQEKKCVKLFIYEKKGQVEGKLDLSAFSSMRSEILCAKKICLTFGDATGKEIESLDLDGRDVLITNYLNGKGKLNKDLVEMLMTVGEKLQLEICIGEKQYISEGWSAYVQGQTVETEDEVDRENVERELIEKENIEQAILRTSDTNLQAEELLPEGDGKRRIVQLAVLEEEMIFRNFSHNSFLLHGYYNYGHIIIDETATEPRLGVPGNYYERERMVATMFGFPYFEPARDKDTIEAGTFGYYYTSAG